MRHFVVFSGTLLVFALIYVSYQFRPFSKSNQHRVNRRRRLRRNLPAELKMEIVDCLSVENAVHFLANVPNRLIIHHCAPRVRRMLRMIDQILIAYARKLPAPDSDGDIWLKNGHKYTPEMDIFLRYGAAHCRAFYICRSISDSFFGYPANFYNDLIKYYYESETPSKAVHRVSIGLSLTNPAPWPMALVHPQAGQMKLKELEVNNDRKLARYFLRNKHNPNIAFMLYIHFDGVAKCYQQMSGFEMWLVNNAQSHGECTIL